MTEKQRRELEKYFNFYSKMSKKHFLKMQTFESENYHARMWALRDVAEIFGYNFEYKEELEENGMTYDVFKLVKSK